jgi:hypothetical protein
MNGGVCYDLPVPTDPPDKDAHFFLDVTIRQLQALESAAQATEPVVQRTGLES